LKDIRKLGRPLNKTIIIDNLEENFKETSYNNGIKITTWIDQMDDRALEILSAFLKKIVLKRVEDIRILFKNFKKVVEKSVEDNINIPEFSNNDAIHM
jgi:RNA polymerase II subunit A small phosphatase-like protein